jgi:hypothetical protein
MYITDQNIIAYESEDNIFCPECWENEFHSEEPSTIITHENVFDLVNDTLFCSGCGEAIWEYDGVSMSGHDYFSPQMLDI